MPSKPDLYIPKVRELGVKLRAKHLLRSDIEDLDREPAVQHATQDVRCYVCTYGLTHDFPRGCEDYAAASEPVGVWITWSYNITITHTQIEIPDELHDHRLHVYWHPCSTALTVP